MNRKDEELWVKKMKDSLGDYSESPPDNGWERLRDELIPPVSMEKRIYSHRIWASAAAVVIIAISAISIYFLNSPVADEIRYTSAPGIAVIPTVAADSAVSSSPVLLAQQTIPVVSREEEAVPPGEEVTDTGVEPVDDDVVIKYQQEDAIEKDDPEVRQVIKPSGKDKLHIPIEDNKSKKKDGNWSIGVSVNSSATNSGGGNYDSGTSYKFQKIDLQQSSSDGIIPLAANGSVYFENGVPYSLSAEEIDYEHAQPISFGLSVRKRIANNISIETGLNYTQLNSDIKYLVSGKNKVQQKLHYIGIPVRVNRDFVNSRPFTVYLSAGGTIEKCIYGTIDGEKETVKPFQFSLNGAVGAQYNILKQVGLYIEPGVSYFFDDGSDVETIRKKRPFNFNLQAGIRFS